MPERDSREEEPDADPGAAAGEARPPRPLETPAPASAPAPGRPAHLPLYISALVICQDAYRDDRGRSHLYALFDSLNATGFPLNARFMVWCSVKGRGAARLVLKIVDTLEATLVVTEPLIAEVTPFKGHEFFFTFNLMIAGAGLYKVIAHLDGIPAMEVPLMVRFAPPPPPPPAAGPRE